MFSAALFTRGQQATSTSWFLRTSPASCCSPAAASRWRSRRTRRRGSPTGCCPCQFRGTRWSSATNVWTIVSTAAFGFLFGFRLPGTWQDGLAALGLCVVYAIVFTIVFIVMGLFAPNAQAAQGMSLIAFVFAFISSAYVPATSMPGWLQPFSKYQPITPMVDAVRSLLSGSTGDVGLALAWCALLVVVFTPVAVIRYQRG